jgi:hypothetical protein
MVGRPALLDDMSQFVCQQPSPFRRARRVLSFAKDDVSRDGERARVDGVSRDRRPGVRMDADAAEVVTES